MKRSLTFYLQTLKLLKLSPKHTVGDFSLLKNPDVFSVQDSIGTEVGVSVPH